MKRNLEYVPDVPAHAILAFFRQPALEFSRRLRASMDHDPQYLESHKRELFVELDRYLRPVGVTLDESKIDEQLPQVVREIVCRLRSYEVNHKSEKNRSEAMMHMDIRKDADAVMTRRPSTNVCGEPFDRETVAKVWAKAQKELWFTFFKRDSCSASIEWEEYGKQTKYGWEIDHIMPVALGGTDDLENLQPLHWQNNRHKGDSYPDWEGKVKG